MRLAVAVLTERFEVLWLLAADRAVVAMVNVGRSLDAAALTVTTEAAED